MSAGSGVVAAVCGRACTHYEYSRSILRAHGGCAPGQGKGLSWPWGLREGERPRHEPQVGENGEGVGVGGDLENESTGVRHEPGGPSRAARSD